MKKKILVTSALPYANGPLHIGHLVEYIQTDVYVRFLRLRGGDVIYCCADDAHGAPVEIKAIEQGITPEELIAKYYDEHVRDFNAFGISFDSYYSTNSVENKKYSDLFFKRLSDGGFIYKKKIKQTYCGKCGRFLPDRFVRGECPKCGAQEQYGDVCESCSSTHKTTDLINAKCALCKNKVTQKGSEHYFFKLSAFSGKLKEWLNETKGLQSEIKNYVLNWIEEGLEDWDITRDGPYFGFKIPGEENKYYYVWLDAPIGYIASTANYCKNRGCKAEDYWQSPDAEIIHFIGKDIIYFHFLFWPAMLMAANFNLPTDIVVHGFLTVNGEKMSKSRGNFFTAREFLEKYDAECLRFYYAKLLSKKAQDIDLTFDDFRDRVNNELVANLGNFCYRVLSFTNKNFDSEIKDIDYSFFEKNKIENKFDEIERACSGFNFNEALRLIMEISALGNKYFQENEPWKLIKEDREKAHKVVGTCVNIAKDLSILISPILPEFSESLQEQLNVSDSTWKDLKSDLKDHKINKAEILVKKMEEKKTEEKKMETVKFDEFKRIDLRVGMIKEVRVHPDADKLYVIKVDLGKETRQLVAGLKEHYAPGELLGKKVVVAANLDPATLRGVRSEGMLLAADDGKKVTIIAPDEDVEVGAKVR